MHPNETILRNLYKDFSSRNASGMASAYSKETHFSDPVFPNLINAEVTSMWAMLMERMNPEAQIELKEIKAEEKKGSAVWEATYQFSKTGRTVKNRIRSEFEFQNGKIVNQKDRFPLWKWTRMALGLPGVLLGWTPMIQGKVRSEAAKNLQHYMKKKGISK
ncbi:polyketide cyclase [Leptospira perolatii]|uniref:Polyketide cyclase n=1 Tax=Leptospira perolatii TaxID=2023191 RepID=A0A2M9ZS22_9LEPT|nr:nuclear transport factor 2 family protein [Leptospira perolatii]PJZ71190.1 polyketide cyclase [Leptospira perolatii]PJZ74723.1 polyketide cyclase [Leptospira perolatii]